MGRMHTRLSEEIEPDIEEYIAAEGVDRRTAISRLVEKGLETWRREQAMDSEKTRVRTQSPRSQQSRIDRCGVALGSPKSET